MKIFSPILKGTTTVAQGTTNLSGSFTGSLFGTAATASYADNFTVGGTLTAQTINVQIITSSIEFNTGSTRNGALSTNTHQFTGSVLMSGSLIVTGSTTFSNTETTINFNPQTSLLAGYNYLNFGGGSIMYRNNTDIYIGSNAKYGSAGTVVAGYTSAVGMGLLAIDGGSLYFQANATSVTAGTAYAVPTRFYISGNGNVGIGTINPSNILHVAQSNTGNIGIAIQNTNASYSSQIRFLNAAGTEKAAVTYVQSDGGMYFNVNTIDALTITNTGRILCGGSVWGTETFGVVLNGSIASATGITAYSVNTGYNGSLIRVQSENSPGTGWYGYELRSASGILRYGIYGNGSVTAPSDERRKKNIETTRDGYLQDVCNLRVVKYNWNEDEEGKDKELGFVAQEVEQIFPKLVETGYDGLNNENEVKLLKQGVLIPILVKAIQELKSENDTLKEILQRNNIQ